VIDREAYKRDGLVIAKGLINKDRILSANMAILATVREQLVLRGIQPISWADVQGSAQKKLFKDFKALYDADQGAYLNVLGCLSRLFSVHRLLYSSAVANFVDSWWDYSVVPTSPVVHVMSKEMMIPNGYFGIDAHQDWPSMQGSLDSFILWIPLMDIDDDLYPLEAIPGSHLGGMRAGVVGENELIIDTTNEADFVKLSMKEGDAAIASSWVVHRSGIIGRDNAIRIACSIRFERLSEETYVKRGFPTAYRRSVDRKLDYAPTVDEVRRQFE
jgi:hypothetical protein